MTLHRTNRKTRYLYYGASTESAILLRFLKAVKLHGLICRVHAAHELGREAAEVGLRLHELPDHCSSNAYFMCGFRQLKGKLPISTHSFNVKVMALNPRIRSIVSKSQEKPTGDGNPVARALLFFLAQEKSVMATRKASDTRQFGLRLRESVCQRLQVHADRNQRPLNTEMARRLERSLEADAMQSVEDAAAALVKRLKAAG